MTETDFLSLARYYGRQGLSKVEKTEAIRVALGELFKRLGWSVAQRLVLDILELDILKPSRMSVPTTEQLQFLQMLSEWQFIDVGDHRLVGIAGMADACILAGWVKKYHSHNDEWTILSLTDSGRYAALGIA